MLEAINGFAKSGNANHEKHFTLLTSAACSFAFLTFAPAAPGQTDDPAAKLQKMRQLRAIHNESAPRIQKILSPQQYQQLQTIRQQEIQQAIAKKRAAGRS